MIGLKHSQFNIGVVGLGYVGLPLIVQLAKNFDGIVGFDLKEDRVLALKSNYDVNCDLTEEELAEVRHKIHYTTRAEHLTDCNFIIVAVPTPIADGNKPDLSYIESSACVVGEHLEVGTTIVFESTVYPGVTEDFCIPIIEKCSGLSCGEDFFVGYSPERVNPADKVNTIDKITKVVSGMNLMTLDKIDFVYSSFTKTHRAPTIKVAEAAKVIENSQRDLNIAFVNELALIFDHLGIDTLDVLEAAGTKWNFLPFRPGLVGGHCISVDPFYLTYKAEDMGIISQVILSGRRVNDSMPHHIVELISRGLNSQRKAVNGSNVLILGATFKENCPDVRNSKVEAVIKELQDLGANVAIHDPYYEGKYIPFEHVNMTGLKEVIVTFDTDIILYAVDHDEYCDILPEDLDGGLRKLPIVDIKGKFGKGKNIIRL